MRVDDRVIDPSRIGEGRVKQGRITQLTDGVAEVRWDNGTQTIQPVTTLRLSEYPTKIIPGPKGYIGYPKNDIHTWGEFAMLAVELGGYGDISLVDPFTGTRLWIGDVLNDGPDWYEAMHRVISAAENVDFFARPETRDPHGLREDARRGRPETAREKYQREMRDRHEQERMALMQRHVEERNAYLARYESTPPGEVPTDDAPQPAV